MPIEPGHFLANPALPLPHLAPAGRAGGRGGRVRAGQHRPAVELRVSHRFSLSSPRPATALCPPRLPYYSPQPTHCQPRAHPGPPPSPDQRPARRQVRRPGEGQAAVPSSVPGGAGAVAPSPATGRRARPLSGRCQPVGRAGPVAAQMGRAGARRQARRPGEGSRRCPVVGAGRGPGASTSSTGWRWPGTVSNRGGHGATPV